MPTCGHADPRYVCSRSCIAECINASTFRVYFHFDMFLKFHIFPCSSASGEIKGHAVPRFCNFGRVLLQQHVYFLTLTVKRGSRDRVSS